jgi:transposase
MRKTYKYRIYLTNGQRRILNTILQECRWVYNQTLEARQFAYQQSIKCSLYDTQAMLPQWKQTRPSLKLVHSQVLQNVQVRVDLAFQAFFRRVAEEAGRTVVLINPRNTSKMCSRCGNLVEKDLSVRVHDCPDCGLVLDRDQNAAINILRLGLQNLRL